MADDQDPEQKTEDPSQKRLEEAFKKGNVPHSRELAHFFLLLTLALTVAWFAPSMLRNTRTMLLPFLASADSIAADRLGLSIVLWNVTLGSLAIIALPLVCAMVAGISASVLQNGLVLSQDPIMPQLERISPLAGLKRMFSMRSVVEFLKGIIKIIVVGAVAFMAVYPHLVDIRTLPSGDVDSLLMLLAMLATRMTIGVAIAMFFITIFDILYQRFQYIKSLRMTKQELKDEYKQSEGDPHIKQRLRRLRAERAKNRMMSNVPTADVVITNPTHFAVALKYDSMVMKAPLVVAKGQDLIALKIREIAIANNVPLVENKPLARALFDSAELDQEIPMAHYEAVAKVISYVYKLRGKRM